MAAVTNGHDRQVIITTALVHALIHGFELTYAAVLAFIAIEFGVGPSILGIVANVFGLAFGSGALPAGFLADKLGSRRLLIFCLLAAAVLGLLVALSPNIWVLAVALSALGAVIGLYHPAGLSLISRQVRRRSMAMGYHGIGGSLGVAMTPLIAAGIAAMWGWRAGYLFLSGAAVLMALLLTRLPERETEPAQVAAKPSPGTKAPPEKFFTSRLLVVYAANTLSGFIYKGMTTFLPLYMKQQTHFTIGTIDAKVIAGSFATIALLFGVFGQLVGGSLAEKIKLEKLAVIVTAATVPALLIMGLTGGVILVVAASVFAFFNFMGQPIYNSLVAEYSPRQFQGRSYGFSFFASFGIGSFSAGLSGIIAQSFGMNWVFIVLAVEALFMLALAAYLRWGGLKEHTPQPAPVASRPN